MDFYKAALNDKLFWRRPSVSLFASLTRITVAAKALRCDSLPRAFRSSCSDKYVIGHCHGSTVSVRTPEKVKVSCHIQYS